MYDVGRKVLTYQGEEFALTLAVIPEEDGTFMREGEGDNADDKLTTTMRRRRRRNKSVML